MIHNGDWDKVAVGNKVVFHPHGGIEVDVNGTLLLVLNRKEVLGVIQS